MKFEPNDLQHFQRLWKESFQEDISLDEAAEKASFLYEMMKNIYKPIPKPSTEREQLSILDLNPKTHEV